MEAISPEIAAESCSYACYIRTAVSITIFPRRALDATYENTHRQCPITRSERRRVGHARTIYRTMARSAIHFVVYKVNGCLGGNRVVRNSRNPLRDLRKERFVSRVTRKTVLLRVSGSISRFFVLELTDVVDSIADG